ncbi:tetratricopeptide repeat protein [Aurantiacibacter aquimixticola]|uniref:Uncharacterized protein n=1 Tax=Aurantiacibacter aquimixticola TaxID=1958945 RepID=A0A419RRU2_9SPHN|nr:tetratricopeptide repeat protein [Aurantiacibacter aquimixticola]RJY08522.1 hypothetical protein D6201_03345 [Aurantiacibacter aquimixticola]
MAQLSAEADLLRGRFEQALATADRVRDANGARIAALAHIGLEDLRSAQAAFEEGLRRSGDRSRLLADYAIFLLEAGDSDAARRLAGQALDIDPDGLDPLFANARVAQARGNLSDALRFYEVAAEVWPESRAALLGRIGMLGELGRTREARPLIDAFVQRAPGDPDALYLQARLAAEDNDWRAVRSYLQPIEGREDARMQMLYARALIELDLPEQAMPRLQAQLRRYPDRAVARRLLARAQLESGQSAAAYATIRPLATSPRGTSQDLAIFTSAARTSGQPSQVEEALERAPAAERLGTLLAAGDAALREQNWRAAIDA